MKRLLPGLAFCLVSCKETPAKSVDTILGSTTTTDTLHDFLDTTAAGSHLVMQKIGDVTVQAEGGLHVDLGLSCIDGQTSADLHIAAQQNRAFQKVGVTPFTLVEYQVDQDMPHVEQWVIDDSTTVHAPTPIPMAQRLQRADTLKLSFFLSRSVRTTIAYPVRLVGGGVKRVGTACRWATDR